MSLFPLEVDTWIVRVAKSMTITKPNMTDDLAQEGRMAAWTAWNNENLMPGDIGYAKGAARRRMMQVVMEKRRQLGSENPRAQIIQEEATEEIPEIYCADPYEGAMLAYHRGEIHTAIQRLTPVQQHVTARIMAGHAPGREGANAWTAARPKLSRSLHHLRELA